MLYMVTFTININIPQMLAYIPYMDPMGYGPMKWPSNSPSNSPSKRQDPWISWIPSTKKGKKTEVTHRFNSQQRLVFLCWLLHHYYIYIYILHNIIYYHHFLLFPSLLYILHIIISVATDTETTTEFATIVRLLRLFITSPDVGFAHRMVEHG